MPCNDPTHPYHEWPTTGKLRIYNCERYCDFCDIGQGVHYYTDASGVRRHAIRHLNKGEYPGLKMEWPCGSAMKYTGPLIDETEDDQPRGIKREAETPLLNDRHGFQPRASLQVHDQPSPAFQQLTTRHITIGDHPFPHSIKSHAASAPTSSSTSSGTHSSPSSAGSFSQPSSTTSFAPPRSAGGAEPARDATLVSTERADAERAFGSLEDALAAFRDQIVGCFRFGRVVGLASVEMGWAVDEAMRVALPGWLEEGSGEGCVGGAVEGEDGDGESAGECSGGSVEGEEEGRASRLARRNEAAG